MDGIMILLVILLIVSCTSAAPMCGKGANIGTGDGVKIEAVNGSRVEMGPFIGNNIITLGSTISVSFRPQSGSGLIFAALDARSNDMVAAYIHDGRLAFARRCQKFYYVGRGKQLQLNSWYTVSYRHSSRGGTMHVDGSNHYREYHMWGCHDLTQLYFGGLPTHLKRKIYWKEATWQFDGCLRNVRLDGTFPDVTPRYSIVSTCQQTKKTKAYKTLPSKG